MGILFKGQYSYSISISAQLSSPTWAGKLYCGLFSNYSLTLAETKIFAWKWVYYLFY